jgi:septation ring formation regulator EzrA
MEAGELASKPKPVVLSEYLQKKQQNIEELKKKLDEVKALYPIPEEQGQKQGSKEPVSKMKEGSDEPIVPRESQRTEEDKRQVLSYCDIRDVS